MILERLDADKTDTKVLRASSQEDRLALVDKLEQLSQKAAASSDVLPDQILGEPIAGAKRRITKVQVFDAMAVATTIEVIALSYFADSQ